MTVRLYKSTDASAPVLTGQAGSLVALLDAILVNGYGSKTAAGWTKAFSATNKAAYRMATSGATGFYMDIDDSAPSTAREARVRGYETMSAIATGTGPFPTVAQFTNGKFIRKSSTADATARPWYVVADQTHIYMFVDTNDVTGHSFAWHFGDFFSRKSGDLYNCMLEARSAENYSSSDAEYFSLIEGASSNAFGQTTARQGVIARHWNATGGAVKAAKFSDMLAHYPNGSSAPKFVMGHNGSPLPYPNGPDGALEMAPVRIGHSLSVRGYLKGIWCPLHYKPLDHGDTFSGTGAMAGKTFIALNVVAGTDYVGNYGQMIVETSDTWS